MRARGAYWGFARLASACGAVSRCAGGKGRAAHGVVGVVQAQAAHDADLLACERREQVLHRQDVVRDLRSGVERGADDFVRPDGLFVVERVADCAGVSVRLRKRVQLCSPSCHLSTGSPRCTWDVSAATKRMRRVHACSDTFQQRPHQHVNSQRTVFMGAMSVVVKGKMAVESQGTSLNACPGVCELEQRARKLNGVPRTGTHGRT